MACGALVFGALAVEESLPYAKTRIQSAKLRKEVLNPEQEGGKAIDWDALRKLNGDIVAWIQIPGTKVDYPVLSCPSFNYYLNHDVKGQKNILGAIFIQPEVQTDFLDCHTVIYGHNMRDQQMFGSLHLFESEKFWKQHQDVFLYFPESEFQATVYSVYDVPDTTETYRTEFDTEAEWKAWIEMSVGKSIYNTGITPEKNDRVITLSTCSNGKGKNSRFVVNCVVKD